MLLVTGLALSACSHPSSLGTGAYDYPTTTLAGGSTTIPPTATTTPRTDWVPVLYGGAEVEVPPSWQVVRLAARACEPARQPGTIWVGSSERSCPIWRTRPGTSANLVMFGPKAGFGLGPVLGHQRVDGYRADIYSFGPARRFGQSWLRGTAAYYFPTLRVAVVFSGPLGVEVVQTIHSAR